MGINIDRERARLIAAETAVFDHYGVHATSDMLDLDEPAMRVRVVTVGSGPPTVLLHGAGMAAPVWGPLLPHLPGRTLHLVDLPGCGLTDGIDLSDADYPAHQAAFVAGVLDALELERAPLVGASLGGWYALRLAVTAPERVSALALVSAPAMALPGARLPMIMAVLGQPTIGRAINAMSPPPSAGMTRRMLAMIGGNGDLDDVPDVMFEALAAAMGLSRQTTLTAAPVMYRGRRALPDVVIDHGELAACHVPTLFIWGDKDKVHGPDAGRRAVDLLPNGSIEVLDGGHGIWFDQPDRCGEALTAFLSSAPPSGP
jgi:2-hydroxy-6-oxonona-2,4-dienedioate hydrolase